MVYFSSELYELMQTVDPDQMLQNVWVDVVLRCLLLLFLWNAN